MPPPTRSSQSQVMTANCIVKYKCASEFFEKMSTASRYVQMKRNTDSLASAALETPSVWRSHLRLQGT